MTCRKAKVSGMIHAGERAFLVLCEELNFTRAAERCFMTQQGLSAHIKKLEDQYGSQLFLRMPNVALTESGEALRLTLLKKESIEEDLVRTIREIDNGSAGRIRFGINGRRAANLAPGILKTYCQTFEKVEIRFSTGDTESLVRKLREGRIDGLLGVNASPAPDLKVETLRREDVLLVAGKGVVNPSSVKKTEKRGKNSIAEVSIKRLAAPDGPVFVRNEEGSTLNRLVDRLLETHGIGLRSQVFISDYHVQFTLCKTLGLAAFCPESIVFAANGPAGDPALQVYRIREMKERMSISLVTDVDRNYPACVRDFFGVVKEVFQAGETF